MNWPTHFRQQKANGVKVTALTAYDYPLGRLLDEAGLDIILVGDSLGMVVLGYPDTTLVTMEDMVHHTRAVARGVKKSLVLADLPYASYETPEQAVVNARRLIDAGAGAVKLEGGVKRLPQIQAIIADGIPLFGHLGMLPQQVREEGGYRIKGKTPSEAQFLHKEAQELDRAGVAGIVLELVKPDVATTLSQSIQAPTIGIGSGANCDGSVLVIHDLVGLFPWFTPRFAKPIASVGAEIREAAAKFATSTRGSVD
jgi:3-methyl-2-oxobutanoate hydroxymethyltransferase